MEENQRIAQREMQERKEQKKMKEKILIVGMQRSGTHFLADYLSKKNYKPIRLESFQIFSLAPKLFRSYFGDIPVAIIVRRDKESLWKSLKYMSRLEGLPLRKEIKVRLLRDKRFIKIYKSIFKDVRVFYLEDFKNYEKINQRTFLKNLYSYIPCYLRGFIGEELSK